MTGYHKNGALFGTGLTAFLLLLFVIGCSPACAAEHYKVLVVFSYEPDYFWEREIREGVEDVFASAVELSYFYMNTKEDPAGGEARAAEAFARYQALKPDGVIAADDVAQELFVVPYLKNKVKTPVTFCGVNAEPEVYGYPAENVTGILERFHLEETLSFNRQLAGQTDTFAVMVNKSLLADLVSTQLEKDRDKLSARLVGVLQPETLTEAVAMAKEYREKTDLLLLLTLKGVVDGQGKLVSDAEAIAAVLKAYAKPVCATTEFVIRQGALCGVLASGQEQGRKAAEMLLKLLQGVALSELPVTRNFQGERMINATVMKELELVPSPLALRGATLVRTQ
ncbi:MAG: ABC transporter substrate-binding protein [Desulfuromonas sp.]|nr:MAG: ABC transporter substrate-binding protein [Desulfuromonas sp.]